MRHTDYYNRDDSIFYFSVARRSSRLPNIASSHHIPKTESWGWGTIHPFIQALLLCLCTYSHGLCKSNEFIDRCTFSPVSWSNWKFNTKSLERILWHTTTIHTVAGLDPDTRHSLLSDKVCPQNILKVTIDSYTQEKRIEWQLMVCCIGTVGYTWSNMSGFITHVIVHCLLPYWTQAKNTILPGCFYLKPTYPWHAILF